MQTLSEDIELAWNACQIQFVECVSKIKHILSVIQSTICGATTCVFSLPISFAMIERIYILCLIIIIKSEVGTITHCLGLGHEQWHALYVFLYSYAWCWPRSWRHRAIMVEDEIITFHILKICSAAWANVNNYPIVFTSEIMITCDYPVSHWQYKLCKNTNMIREDIANFPPELLMPSR